MKNTTTQSCIGVRSMWLMVVMVAFSAFTSSMNAQVVTVLDDESGAGVDLVTIISQNPKCFVLTDESGKADVSEFRGSLRIEIRALGYITLTYAFHELEAAKFVVRLTRSSLRLDEVVVSATRWRQPSGDVSGKILTIKTKDVQLQNPQTAADLLELSGKVFVQRSQQGGGSPMIRGFSANRLLYSVDGVRMNSAIFRSGNLQNIINIDPFAIESTEVLFGPGSVIYGSDAIGGVMSFQTLTPEFSKDPEKPFIKGKADFRYASANQENTGHFDVNVGWEKWAIVTSFSSWRFDHLRQGRHGPDDYLKPSHVQRIDSADVVVQQDDPLLQVPSGYSQVNFMQKVRYAPNDKVDIQYGFHYSETSSYGRYDRHNRLQNGLPRHARWDYGPQVWMMNNLTVNRRDNTRLYDEATLRLAHQRFEESRVDRNFNGINERTTAEVVDAFSMNFDLTKALGERHRLFYGSEAVVNDVRSSGISRNIATGATSGTASRYPNADWMSMAVYISDEFRASEQLTLNAGVRYNFFSMNAVFDTTFFNLPFSEASLMNDALSGSVGAVWRPEKTWVLSANVGSAFRAPNVDDIGKVFDSEPGAVVVPNPDLRAEYAYSADVSAAKIIAERVKVDLTLFYTLLENAMVRRDFLLNGQDTVVFAEVPSRVQAIQNAATANVYGVQAGVDIRIGQGFSLASDLNWQVGTEEMDDGTVSASRHAPPLFGVTRLNYTRDRLNLQVYAMYQGEQSHERLAIEERSKTEIYALDANGNAYAPAWCTLNVKSMYAVSDQLAVSAGLENITDRRYRSYSSGISAPGRNFILSARLNF